MKGSTDYVQAMLIEVSRKLSDAAGIIRELERDHVVADGCQPLLATASIAVAKAVLHVRRAEAS